MRSAMRSAMHTTMRGGPDMTALMRRRQIPPDDAVWIQGRIPLKSGFSVCGGANSVVGVERISRGAAIHFRKRSLGR
jgi:hypothetical protein